MIGILKGALNSGMFYNPTGRFFAIQMLSWKHTTQIECTVYQFSISNVNNVIEALDTFYNKINHPPFAKPDAITQTPRRKR